MNVYVCKVRINAVESMAISITAMTKAQAKTICRNTLRHRGYNIVLKDINVLYIDNNRPSINKPLTAFCNAPHRIRESIANQINFWCTYCTWRHNPATYYVAHERVNVELSEYAAYNPYC